MRFDINPTFRGNKLEDLARPYGEHWVHCKLRDDFHPLHRRHHSTGAPFIYQRGQTDPHRRSLSQYNRPSDVSSFCLSLLSNA